VEYGKNRGYLVKISFYLLERCIRRGVQQKDFGRYFQYLVKLGVFFNIS
jgi:hypothetical protein